MACTKQLVPGDEFALRSDGLYCKEDHQVRCHLTSRVGVSDDLDKNDDLMTPNDAKMT